MNEMFIRELRLYRPIYPEVHNHQLLMHNVTVRKSLRHCISKSKNVDSREILKRTDKIVGWFPRWSYISIDKLEDYDHRALKLNGLISETKALFPIYYGLICGLGCGLGVFCAGLEHFTECFHIPLICYPAVGTIIGGLITKVITAIIIMIYNLRIVYYIIHIEIMKTIYRAIIAEKENIDIEDVQITGVEYIRRRTSE